MTRDLGERLYRRESARMVAALTRLLGGHALPLAEDVVHDAFCRAMEAWRERGVPDDPAAWLMATAKRRAIDVLRRERTARAFAPAVARALDDEDATARLVDEAFAPHAIRDGQLRMMFACCHPRLPDESRVALVLNVLCGFVAAEIASALLVGQAAIEKRIARGKRTLAGTGSLVELADAELPARIPSVQRALYLLFNEGYHGASRAAVRAELCREAMRLTVMLREFPPAATPATDALLALMCLHAARLPARLDAFGELSAIEAHDRARWSRPLLARGLALLRRASRGTTLSAYHVEAAIAAAHASAPTVAETDWTTVVALYDQLLAIAPGPVAALNRAIALGQRDGPASALAALDGLADDARLARYPFLPAARAEFARRLGDAAATRAHLARALTLARNGMERRFLARRLAALGEA